MPLMTSDCRDLESLCCEALFAFADHLRVNSMEALGTCFETDRCNDLFQSYVSMGAGDDGIPDSLIVSPNQMNPSPGTQPVGPSLWQMTFDVRLRESGYPIVEVDGTGKVISMPDPARQHMATRQMMAHGEAIHRRLAYMKASRQLAPSGYQCLNGTVGQMLPITPQGGVVGYTILVTVNLPWS